MTATAIEPVVARVTRSRPGRPTAALVGAAGYVGALHVVDPFETHAVGCPFLGLTGWWCPGCGSSRAIHCLSRGDLPGSLTYHPFVLPIVALLAWWWASWFVTVRSGAAPSWARTPTQLPPRVVVGIAAAFVTLWVLRNIDTFAFLAPPG